MDPQLSKEAENDIRFLIAYGLQTFGEAAAQKYFSELSNSLASLSQNPLMAPTCLRRDSRIRRFVFRSHVVYFVINHPTILVLRVLHQRQDPMLEFIDSSL